MKYRLYTTSKKAWDAMLKAISSAQKSIYLEMYIFMDDTDTHDFIGLLKQKSLSGVSVVLIIDAFGSLSIKRETINDLRAAGAEVLFFSHFWHRTHRKIIIIDDGLAFVGGVNIEKKIIHWQDIQIMIAGKKTVRAVARAFAKTYQLCGGKNPIILAKYRKSKLKKIKSLVWENLPGHHLQALSDYYKAKIIAAKKSIKIVTPYFIPPRWFVALLDDARRRGVEIEIIVPLDTDHKILNKINYSYISELSPWGIKFYGAPQMNHAKILIVDNEEALIGSQNIDALSLNRNFEVGVSSRQKQLVKDLGKIFEDWKRKTTPFQIEKNRVSWLGKIKVGILRLFFSII
jgi:cardiolipin synthase